MLEIEDGRRHGSERTCDLHNFPCHHAPRTDIFGYFAGNTHTSEFTGDTIGVFPRLLHRRTASLTILRLFLSRYRLHEGGREPFGSADNASPPCGACRYRTWKYRPRSPSTLSYCIAGGQSGSIYSSNQGVEGLIAADRGSRRMSDGLLVMYSTLPLRCATRKVGDNSILRASTKLDILIWWIWSSTDSRQSQTKTFRDAV
jgi:hypothetical protein